MLCPLPATNCGGHWLQIASLCMTANSLSRLEASIVYVIASLWPLTCCDLWLQQTMASSLWPKETTFESGFHWPQIASLWPLNYCVFWQQQIVVATIMTRLSQWVDFIKLFEASGHHREAIHCGIPIQFIVVSLRPLKFISVVGSVHERSQDLVCTLPSIFGENIIIG